MFIRIVSLFYIFWTLLFAPVPVQRPIRQEPLTREHLIGIWKMKWGDTLCQVDFKEGGEYHHVYCGTPYRGFWDFRNGILYVEEWTVACPTEHKTYHVKLMPDRDKRGKIIRSTIMGTCNSESYHCKNDPFQLNLSAF